ncbi:hypothetical protein DN752_21120 [Echinicola strongylocentroti]|uniref:DUF5675 domain-containing protein n=1 Tax=Echinicola strongylocentroti TaxID=1795355 RepID=A0A2Z4INH5_9BACT|nr:DUF5675 family protein [Echinicola strongylocentroti]AWW32445.1 hypothetical protein DN752_21120 [Echinicola strongylocentroti]
MNSLVLIRTHFEEKQTLGQLFVLNDQADELFSCFTLELPWKDNEQFVSCIPAGRYKVVPRNSEKYGDHLHILGVPDRSLILIHEANFYFELLGCICIGRKQLDINGDSLKDVTSSVATKNKLLSFITQPTEISIS